MKSKNKKPNAWITGHTGFIGQQLTNELKQKNEIFKVSRNDIIEKNKYFKKKIKIDSVEKNKLKKFNNNYLFHLATLYNPNPKSNNIKMYKIGIVEKIHEVIWIVILTFR